MPSSLRRHATVRSVAALVAVLSVASVLRIAWLTADPPTQPGIGVVWHDEGAWVHNARNRALWGVWRTDEWNPVFVAPVFTALEYGAFRMFGVGTWQARTVPVASGLLAVALLSAGLWAAAGFVAGAAVVLAFFTKAAAAFFVAALVLDAAMTLVLAGWGRLRHVAGMPKPSSANVRAASWVLGGIAVAAAIVILTFVLPYWSEYRFYNWQMSVTRKPSYALRSLIDRASWLPIVHDFFTRMWLLMSLAGLATTTIVLRWRTARAAERLLVLWVILGLAELVVHDAGNERRYVMFIPALVALAALVLGQRGPVSPPVTEVPRFLRWLSVPVVFLFAYLVLGSLVRLLELGEVGRGVRFSAAAAVLAGGLILWRWASVCEWLSRQRVTRGAAIALTAIAITGDLVQYWQWASRRTRENYEASIAIGRTLPPGTLVHGKLANGLSLENSIKPIFVGRGFGNYEDRTSRDDVRYILTYIAPSLGYESQRQNPVIEDVLDAYPNRAIIMTFDVAETATGHDKAALIDKFGGAAGSNGQTTGRAKN